MNIDSKQGEFSESLAFTISRGDIDNVKFTI